MSEPCKNLDGLMQFEREQFAQEIENYKYLESEKAGHDIGRHAAVNEFAKNHYFEWAKEKRQYFCTTMCQYKCGK